MSTWPERFVGVGVIDEQQQLRRSPSLEKSQIPFFAGWHESSLSPPPGLRPPQPPSPQPSPKSQLPSASGYPWESRRPLRLGERPQGCLTDSTPATTDFAFHSSDAEESDLTPRPIELHPAVIKRLSQAPASTTPDTSDLSSGGEFSEASSFAHALKRERINKRSFKKAMIPPKHLITSNIVRPSPPRTIVSSPAIVMQSAPRDLESPSPLALIRSMTFSEALNATQDSSPASADYFNQHVPTATSKISKVRNRRIRSSQPTHVNKRSADGSAPRTHHSGSSFHELRPPSLGRQMSSESFQTRDSHTGSHVSFTSASEFPGSVGKNQPPPSAPDEDAPKHPILRTLTVPDILPTSLKRKATQSSSHKKRRLSLKRLSIGHADETEREGCFGLLRPHFRKRASSVSTQASVPTDVANTGSSPATERLTSGGLARPEVARLRRGSYVGSDGREYAYRPGLGLSFLPSEMQRVNTPPMGVLITSGGRPAAKVRGFFFDHTKPPGSDDGADGRRDSVARSTKLEPPLPGSQASKTASMRPDYFRQRMDQVESEMMEDEDQEVAKDVPDHLPSSPLCPLHPKHPMGGRLLCPMHGKGKGVAARGLSKDGKTATFRGMLL